MKRGREDTPNTANKRPKAPDNINNLTIMASVGNRESIIKLMELVKSDVALDKAENNLIHYAAQYNHPDLVRDLSAREGNLNLSNVNGDTPLNLAIKMGNDEVVKELLNNKANLEIKDIHNSTPLQNAVMLQKQNIVELLVSN
jgi:ankyrin repeat protein